jgi:hypothetical protein
VATSLKASVAILAALGAFVFGAEVAHAGVLDPIVEEPPVVQPAPLVDDAVSDVVATADEVVSDAREAVGETAPEPSEALGNVAAPLAQIVDKTPADELVSGVTRTADPVIRKADPVIRKADPVIASVAEGSRALTTGASQEAPASGTTEPAAAQVPTAASEAPPGEAMRQMTRPGARSDGSATRRAARPVSSNRQYGGATGRIPPLVLKGLPEPTAIAVTGARDDGSPTVPARPRPFAPLFPGGTSTTAALVAGAAGGALTAALLCALMLLAPRTGRVMRPGRILVRPATCLSLVERPG